MIYLFLLFLFMYYGCFCLSGGSTLMQFYINDLVNTRHWLTLEEFGNFQAISQITPGPIGINLATFLGYQQGGILGGLVATIGLLLPSFFLMSLAVHSYGRWQHSPIVRSIMFGIKPMATALITAAILACLGMSIFTKPIPFEILIGRESAFAGAFDWRPEMLPILIFAVLAMYKKKMSIMAVIFSSALCGGVMYLLIK